MRSKLPLRIGTIAAFAALVAARPATERSVVSNGIGPTLQSIGALTFGSNGVLYVADPQNATIFALELGDQAATGTAGTKNIAGFDQQVAATLGTGATDVTIADLAVDPRTKNSYVAVMRGQGADAKPVLMRVDGAGAVTVVGLDNVKFSSVSLPNAPSATNVRNRAQSVTDMAFSNGKLYVAGLSSEEFSSKLWGIAYPFTAADRGTSVEIFHGNHGVLETRSPVFTFVPYMVGNQPHLIAGYTCTPLVKFPLASLTPGSKVLGTTIAELGAGNRPIDMVVYKKDGKEFLLMSNSSRGVMKIPTADFATQAPITARVGGTAGISYETIASMTGIQQLDLLDATRSIVIAKTATGLNLEAVILP